MTLFASGDSETSASLVPITERSLRLNPHCIEAKGHTVRLVNPLLPHWLPSVRVSNLRIGNATVDLLLERHPHDVGVTVLRREGRVTVEVVK